MFLDEKNQDLIKSACSSAISLAELLNSEDRASLLLTMILKILHDEEEETKLRALITLKELISYLTPDICESFVVKEAMILSSESTVKVRKSVAECIPKLSKLIKDTSSFDKLMKVFEELGKDSIWGVRKACAESISEMMEFLDAEAQNRYLIPAYQELLADKSNSVRHSAMLQLGPCIHHCKIQVPESFISAFVGAAKNTSNKSELQHHCAFYFPAVLLKLGKSSWPLLSQSYNFLICEGDNQCKKCLISSMHEVGAILEQEISTNDLLPLYEKVITENAASKNIAISYLGKVLSILLPDCRLSFLKYIKTMYKVSASWRIRLSIAEQLHEFVDLFTPDIVVSELAPVIFYLADDKFAKVREKAAGGLGKLINFLIIMNENHELIVNFKQMASSSSSSLKKQTFALACQELVADQRFTGLFGNELKILCEEKTHTIRVCCARVVKKARNTWKNEDFWVVLEKKLSHDFDADVRFEVTGKYDVERGISKLRPNSKKPAEILLPMFRALFPDDDVQEVINFTSTDKAWFGVLKTTITPEMNGFLEDFFLKSVNKNKMLIDF